MAPASADRLPPDARARARAVGVAPLSYRPDEAVTDGDRAVVMMTGERKGRDRDRRCVYNTRTNEAQFEDQRGP
jgi:hypothetical protein